MSSTGPRTAAAKSQQLCNTKCLNTLAGYGSFKLCHSIPLTLIQANKEQYGSGPSGSTVHQHQSLNDSNPVPLLDSASLTEQKAMHEQQVVFQHHDPGLIRHCHQQQGAYQQQGDHHHHLTSQRHQDTASGSVQYAAPFSSSYNDNISDTTTMPGSQVEYTHAIQQFSDGLGGQDSECRDHSHMQAELFNNCAHYAEQEAQLGTVPTAHDNAAGLQAAASATHHVQQPFHHSEALHSFPHAWPSASPEPRLYGSGTAFQQRPNVPQHVAQSAAPILYGSAAVACITSGPSLSPFGVHDNASDQHPVALDPFSPVRNIPVSAEHQLAGKPFYGLPHSRTLHTPSMPRPKAADCQVPYKSSDTLGSNRMRPKELQSGIGSPITGEVALMGTDAPVSKPITSMWKRIKPDDQVFLINMVLLLIAGAKG